MINLPLVISFLIVPIAYACGMWAFRRSGRRVWAHPFFVGFCVLVALILGLNIAPDTFDQGTLPYRLLLGTATTALAVPIWKHMTMIRRKFVPLLLTILIANVLTTGSALGVLMFFGADRTLMIAMSTKSVTTPLAVALNDSLGGMASLAATIVMVTGLIGAMAGQWLLEKSGDSAGPAVGVTFGLVSHAIGTSRALEISQETGAFSALAMSLNGLVTALLLPFLWGV